MNVLFYSTYHFNTETFGPYLELMQRHLNDGDTVYFLGCDGELSSCQTNPQHSKLICSTCISTRINALKCLNGKVQYLSIDRVLAQEQINPHLELIDTSSIEAFKNCQYETFDIGMAVMSSVVSVYRDPAPDLKQHSALIEKQWTASMQVYQAVKKCITEKNIDRVYVFNARFATLRACLRASQQLNCNCFVLEESNDRTRFAVYENAMPHSIAYVEKQIENYWANGGADKESIAMAYYVQRSQGKDSRFGHFTAHQDQSLLPKQWNPAQENIVIFISSEDEFVSIGKEWENHLYKNQVDGIMQMSTALLAQPQFKFYVRVHPNLSGILNESIEALYAIDHKNVVIIPAESPISTYNLMFHASKVISFGSSVGIEAAAFGKISILAGKAFYMNLGCTYNPANHDELVALLAREDLTPKPKDGALKYAFYLLNFGQRYQYFKRKDTFQAEVNEQLYGPKMSLLLIRRIGRIIRKAKEKRRKKNNLQRIAKLAARRNQ